jgi:2',3'-cyclic-nucleotide 2'-phosphodiesterase (5'-nucleotidase family)
MGYDAIAVGPRDLVAGVKFLKRTAAKNGLRLLSANLLKDGEKVFKPWIVVRKNGMKIGIVGLTGSGLSPLVRKELQVDDPLKSARAAVAELKNKADIIMLLSSAGHNVDLEILKKVPEVNIVVGAGVGSSFLTPLDVNGSFVLRSMPKGKTIGKAMVVLTGRSDHPLKVTGHLVTLDKRFEKDPDIEKKAASFNEDYRKDSINSIKKLFGSGGHATVKQGNHGKTGPAAATNPFLEAIKRSQQQQQQQKASSAGTGNTE